MITNSPSSPLKSFAGTVRTEDPQSAAVGVAPSVTENRGTDETKSQGLGGAHDAEQQSSERLRRQPIAAWRTLTKPG